MPVGAIYLTETSPGAPALSGTNGALCNVLDWALPQKGWAIEYTATNNRIYRPGAGNRNRLFVSHDSTVSGDQRLATVRGCENASAANASSLVAPFPTTTQVANNNSTFLVSTSMSTVARPYRIILTDRFLVMSTSAQGVTDSNWDLFLFGDLYGTDPHDSWATICHIGASSTAGSNGRGMSSCISSVPYPSKTYFCRTIDGTILSSRGSLYASCASLIDMGNVTNTPPARSGYANRVERETVGASCGGATTSTPGSLAILKRGWVPHLYNPVHSGLGTMTSDDFFTDSEHAVGSNFTFLIATNTAFSILETTDTWNIPNG